MAWYGWFLLLVMPWVLWFGISLGAAGALPPKPMTFSEILRCATVWAAMLNLLTLLVLVACGFLT